jgi:hypothetical protein
LGWSASARAWLGWNQGERVVLPSPTGSNLGSGNWRKMIILSENFIFLGFKMFNFFNKTKKIQQYDCAFFKFILLLGVATVTNSPKHQRT